jgi:predicted DNA binding protein
MYRLSFEIEHRGCWASDMSKRWPTVSFQMRSSVPVQGGTRDILSVRADSPATVLAVGESLRAHPSVRSATLLDADGGTAFFLVDGESGESLIRVITMHGGFLVGPTQLVEGRERWAVGLAYRDHAKALLDALAAHGAVQMQGLVRDTFPDLRLTSSQRRVLLAAIAGGYYDFPRGTSPTDLAKYLGLAKSTVLEHLQKAESKIILSHEQQM